MFGNLSKGNKKKNKMQNVTIHTAAGELKKYYPDAKEQEMVTRMTAAKSAGEKAARGFLWQLTIPETVFHCSDEVRDMYKETCTELNIELQDSTVAILADEALSEISRSLVYNKLLGTKETTGLFNPQFVLITVFTTLVLAEYVFYQLLLEMATSSKDLRSFSDVEESRMSDFMKNVKLSREDVESAKHMLIEIK